MTFACRRSLTRLRCCAILALLAVLLPLPAAAQQRVVPESREEMQLSFAPVVRPGLSQGWVKNWIGPLLV